jgi:V/A-type H+/Na+-transporting ATPase subunit E
MGFRELIDALRSEGEEKVRAFWKEAEEDAQRIREETSVKAGELRERYSELQASSVEEKREAVLSVARREVQNARFLAEKELSDRLYRAALRCLHHLRDEGYSDIFHALVRELPPRKWHGVRVYPEDQDRAREHFPDAEIIPDDAISGGLEVSASEGSIRVINTFEKRLERIWPEILPELLHDIHGLI